jgi:ketosteroid isomerase-like protein
MNGYIAALMVGTILSISNFAVAQTPPTKPKAKEGMSIVVESGSNNNSNKSVDVGVGGEAGDQASNAARQPTNTLAVIPSTIRATTTPAPSETMQSPVEESHVIAVPTQPVVEMPKADHAFFEGIITDFNNKDIDALISNYSKEELVVVNEKGEVFNDREAIRQLYISMLSGNKKVTASINVDKVIDVAPGVALFCGKVSFKIEGEKDPSDLVFTSTLKYEDGSWKIVSKQTSIVSTLKADEHERPDSNGVKMLITLFIGAVIGYLGSKMFSKKNQASA